MTQKSVKQPQKDLYGLCCATIIAFSNIGIMHFWPKYATQLTVFVTYGAYIFGYILYRFFLFFDSTEVAKEKKKLKYIEDALKKEGLTIAQKKALQKNREDQMQKIIDLH
ncbi:hypothetical protein [Wohlfahrtiimonas chitiniclastica]|uniref:hypothetical protein n=1 Tax=Wohlfahrtiimonas chitiniclastica TaxID=400946 RepID=UPI001BCE2C19|nr:hypothetical protein [Wohlfahrtiimonas chitiniclastica]MBS7815861.1 hypothetical protein [Wohlfahrtiimonas chitiniclastica]MBS7822144.1 hypothetical protein [Wohlfahrtiimonas chitiniclastica]MBS7829936.1 hypothetical protein [Wohlfahrtiimonas chitiniclastica]MBS7831903.1 hypothetical protein [Wohlfahrtiimonas chitiniclastica]